jgi:hypothetical protein
VTAVEKYGVCEKVQEIAKPLGGRRLVVAGRKQVGGK